LSDVEYDRIEELAGLHDLTERLRNGLGELDDAQRAVLRLRVDARSEARLPSSPGPETFPKWNMPCAPRSANLIWL
jgi:hypothetical protein